MSADLLTGFDPVITSNCTLVVLGSFPSAASLAAGHYYAHPRNQFWPIMAQLTGRPLVQMAFAARYRELNQAGIGLWDVIAHCRRPGSLDSDIRDSQAVQLERIMSLAPGVRALALNGRKAQSGARRMQWGAIDLIDLPSTSPANASVSPASKLATWLTAVAPYLK